ncbi:hypothetical protein AB0O47_32055 [Streptomyces noursei]|uniref:hypothetical protein n=1 Tax=Streptomyces noursei TaxID=1971 RepID=UPI00345030CA
MEEFVSQQAQKLREVAAALEALASQSGKDGLPPLHPDTARILESRSTKRGQLNYAVPTDLQLKRRIARAHVELEIAHGDIVAQALDGWLRARGIPPVDERKESSE